MSELYLIKWYDKRDPSKIGGGKSSVTKDIAQAWVKELNAKYPYLVHFTELSPNSVKSEVDI